MKAPISWLKDFVDIDCSAAELAEKLFSCGFEVEGITVTGEEIQNVVAAKILTLSKHPNADKLLICSADAGSHGVLQIVTGAPNVAAGDMVPLALDGAALSGGQRIKTGKLRGELSQGMFCGGEELGLTGSDYPGAEVDGLLQLPKETLPGSDIKQVLGLGETVLDIAVTANRPDCQSIAGIAREVAAVLNKPWRAPKTDYTATSAVKVTDLVSVTVEDAGLCPRYLAAAVTDIKIEESPEYIKRRLRLCGIRPINNIVDVTNYVLLEVGQPMHAFDGANIAGNQIIVRRARQGETLTTLDERGHTLADDMLVICDSSGPVALAGVMGGLNSGIGQDTHSVVFESAKFRRDNIRRTSKQLGLRTDSSARFEKGIDAQSPEIALSRALHLIEGHGWGKVAEGVIDVSAERPSTRTVKAPLGKIAGLLGIDVPTARIQEILSSLGIESKIEKTLNNKAYNETDLNNTVYNKKTANKTIYNDNQAYNTAEKTGASGGGTLICSIPPHRDDIEDYADIAEEIIRMYGYDNITPTLFAGGEVISGQKTPEQKAADKIKGILVYLGMREIVSYAFTSKKMLDTLSTDGAVDAIRLINPLSEDIASMRTTLLTGVLSTAALNLSRRAESLRLFETGRVYLPKSLPLTELPEEEERIALAVCGEGEDFYTLKGVIEALLGYLGIETRYTPGGPGFMHPGRSAQITAADGTALGVMGELHPDSAAQLGIKKRLYCAELNAAAITACARDWKGYKSYAKLPGIDRDIALVVPAGVTHGQIIDTITAAGGSLLERTVLFDVYEGEKMQPGKKSMAYSLHFQAADRTLQSEEADKSTQKILAALSKLGITLRDN